LLGRDRFEGKCAACREEEVLAELPLAEDLQTAPVPKSPPAESAPEPVRRRWLLPALIVAAGAVTGLAAVLVLPRLFAPEPRRAGPTTTRFADAPRKAAKDKQPGKAPPKPAPVEPIDEAKVRLVTSEFLDMVRRGDYERVIDNYCQPDDDAFGRVEQAVTAIVDGPSTAGFRRWSVRQIRRGRETVIRQLQSVGDPHPDYTADLLSFLTQNPGASNPNRPAEDRARAILEWHLRGLYDLGDSQDVTVAGVRQDGRRSAIAELSGVKAPAAPRPGDAAGQVRWRRLPVGWVLRLALPERIEDARKTLAKPLPDQTPK
jgi:hypothetical protein